MSSHFIAGIDIGTASIKTVVAENRGGKPVPRLIFKTPSSGIERGAVVDIAEVSRALSNTIHESRKVSRHIPKNIYVNLGTHQMKCQNSRGIVAVSRADTEIYQDDIDRVVRASQAISFAPNWMIVHHVPKEFIVDGMGDIENPLGLSGSRLEVNSLLITAFTRIVKDLMKVVEVSGGRIGGLVCSPLAASRSVLSKKQKRLGTALVDIGAGTTGLTVYEGNKLLGAAIIPMGAQNITNDIAVGIKVPVAVAEKVKTTHGYALAREIGTKETIDLAKCDHEEGGNVSRRFVADIIQARLAEILDLVDNELKVITKAVQLPGGVVFVGGGAKLPGLTQLARQHLGLTSQIGLALEDEWANENQSFAQYFEDPEFANVLGLVLSGVDKESWALNDAEGFTPQSVVRFVKNFLP